VQLSSACLGGAVVLATALIAADKPLYLKRPPAAPGAIEAKQSVVRRCAAARSHYVVQFDSAPTLEQLEQLRSRGAVPVEYVPQDAVLMSIEDGAYLGSAGVKGLRRLAPAEKLSADMDQSAAAFVVAFHHDVNPADARLVVAESGLASLHHPDLLPNDLLVEGSLRDLARLAEWDEVAYIFPASTDLIGGQRVHACIGALTGYGPVGQYIAKISAGWDGPGLGRADLGYYFGALASGLPRTQAQSEILRALSEWTKYADLSFSPAPSPAALRTVSILFASGAHGDPYPFDGPGAVLAHTFYPVPANTEPIAGDMHFDDAENWSIGQQLDLFSVALHEAGHALGLAHSDSPSAVMYPYYRRVSGLNTEDITAIRQIYASVGTSTPSTPANPPSQPNPQPSDRVAPVITITYPAATTVLTYDASIRLRGSTTDNVGVAGVSWSDSLGAGGAAAGTAWWTTPDIPLREGSNTITVRAVDAAGNVGWRSVTITRRRR
jgi:hypothetical protein